MLHYKKRKEYDRKQAIAEQNEFIATRIFDYFDENKNDQIEQYVPHWDDNPNYGDRYSLNDLFTKAGVVKASGEIYSSGSFDYPVFAEHLFERISKRRGWNDVQPSDRNLVGYLFNYLTYQQIAEIPFGNWDQIFEDPTFNRALEDFTDQGLNAEEYKGALYDSVYDSLDYSQYHQEFIEEFVDNAQHRKYNGLGPIKEAEFKRTIAKQAVQDAKSLAEIKQNILDPNASKDKVREALKYPMSDMKNFVDIQDVDNDILKLVNSQPFLDFKQVDDDVLGRAAFQIDDRIKYHQSREGQKELKQEFDYGHTYGSMPNCVRKALICNLSGKDIVAAYKRAYM